MEKSELVEGDYYWLNTNGHHFLAKLISIETRGPYGSVRRVTRYHCFKLFTKRNITIKSRLKFIRRATEEDLIRKGYIHEAVDSIPVITISDAADSTGQDQIDE